VDVAEESKDNWEALEVDDAHAVHVKVWEGETRRAEFWLGAYKTGHTMLRLPGDDRVYKVAGSLQRVFGKRTSDWREKTILAEESKNVTRIALTTPEGEWTFDKDGEDWVQALEEGEEGLEHFDGKKLRSLVSSVARLRAADFADDVSPSDAGLDSPRGRIAFTVTTPPAEELEVKDADRMIEEQDAGEDPMAPEPAEVETFRILVGDDVDDETYIMVEGDPQIYLVATRVAERLLPGPDKLTTPPKPEGEAEAAPVAPPMNMGQDSSIPPEVMKQVQAEIQKQKMMKQLMQKQAP